MNSPFKDEFTDELEAETTLELSGVGDQMEIGDQARFKNYTFFLFSFLFLFLICVLVPIPRII